MSVSRASRRPIMALAVLVALGMALGVAGRVEAAAVPAAPTNLHLCQSTPAAPCWSLVGSIWMFWNDNAIDEARYEVQWVRAAPPLVWQTAPLPANATSAFTSGLTPGQRYYFRVRACNASGCSAYSNTIAAWP
jgi:hypothetical protein